MQAAKMKSFASWFWLVLALSCGSSDQGQILFRRLRCGMSIPEIEKATGHQVKGTESQQRLGSHKIHTDRSEVWLEFSEGGLVSVTEGRKSGFTSLRLSPKRNLCTGGLTFYISLEWEYPLQGSDVLLDGSLVESNAASGLIFEAASGKHRLEIVKKGYRPVVRDLNLGAEDAGRQDIFVKATELHQLAEGDA
jgi:hypothetical protein